MTRFQALRAGALALCAIIFSDPALAQSAPPERLILGSSDVPGTKLETRLYLVTYPPGASAPPHVHPVVGVGYVLEREADSQFRGGPLTHLKTGDRFADLATVPHDLFRNPSATTPLRFVIAHTIKKGVPTLSPLP